MKSERHQAGPILKQLREQAGLTQAEVGDALGLTDSAVQSWEYGESRPMAKRRAQLAELYGVGVRELGRVLASKEAPILNGDKVVGAGRLESSWDTQAAQLNDRLSSANAVDDETLALLAQQADQLRALDRELGSRATQAQVGHYLELLAQHLAFALPGPLRTKLASLYADACSLAGWQAFDAGQLAQAWQHFETAKAAGQESASPASWTHAMAEQAYLLLELGQPAKALQLAARARHAAGEQVPPLLQAWLAAVEGELFAATGDRGACQQAFEAAWGKLPAERKDPAVPYVFLSDAHLGRWYGHALARLGDGQAIGQLERAVEALDGSFMRARAGGLIELGRALVAAGERAAGVEVLEEGRWLAVGVGSVRLVRRAVGSDGRRQG